MPLLGAYTHAHKHRQRSYGAGLTFLPHDTTQGQPGNTEQRTHHAICSLMIQSESTRGYELQRKHSKYWIPFQSFLLFIRIKNGTQERILKNPKPGMAFLVILWYCGNRHLLWGIFPWSHGCWFIFHVNFLFPHNLRVCRRRIFSGIEVFSGNTVLF